MSGRVGPTTRRHSTDILPVCLLCTDIRSAFDIVAECIRMAAQDVSHEEDKENLMRDGGGAPSKPHATFRSRTCVPKRQAPVLHVMLESPRQS